MARTDLDWPSADQWRRVLTLRDYNTRMVLAGTVLLGVCSGAVGTFMLLRRRALVGDVVSHAALPGIGVAFLVLESFEPGRGKWLPGLLIGATVAGLLGVGCVNLLRRSRRIRDDAALAIVLSFFFGLGIVLFTVIQRTSTGNSAGLHQFIYGKAASIVASDVRLILVVAFVALVICVVLFKEFAVLSFDAAFAASRGWPTQWLDGVLLTLVVSVTVIGLQSVGLLLVVALLIVPPAAARFWSDRLAGMAIASAAIGGLAALGGVLTSALFPRLAAGAVIVLCGSLMFLLSLLLGTRRGVLPRIWMHRALRRRMGRDHLLRALYELQEARQSQASNAGDLAWVPYAAIARHRGWSARELSRAVRRAMAEGLIANKGGRHYGLTESGQVEARHAARHHRLWELYLIHFADIAPTHVDRSADAIEHVLDPTTVAELERLLADEYPRFGVPKSPHEIAPAAEAADGR
ncbi:MAG: metal ABC transporter permease [Planctomycetales bacterium]|nr:metal ABC transporter permease [Planctomycetales bacterium]